MKMQLADGTTIEGTPEECAAFTKTNSRKKGAKARKPSIVSAPLGTEMQVEEDATKEGVPILRFKAKDWQARPRLKADVETAESLIEAKQFSAASRQGANIVDVVKDGVTVKISDAMVKAAKDAGLLHTE